MSAAGPRRPRVLAVGEDAEVCAALHAPLERAGHAVWCVPAPDRLDAALQLAAPDVLLLLLPALPDASWGGALSTAAAVARVGVRVIVVAPSAEVVEPLAAVAGAERALSRADLLARPLAAIDPPPARPAVAPPPFVAPPRPAPVAPAGSVAPAPPAAPAPGAAPAPTAPTAPVAAPATPPQASSTGTPDPLPALATGEPFPRAATRPRLGIAALFDEELEPPRATPPARTSRIEVNVSLVSEHNFYVGPTRRVDSGGVFVSTAVPPPAGTRIQLRLGLADGRKLDVDGEVAFVRPKSGVARQPSGCGVRLLAVPGWAAEAIDRFTQARTPIVWR